MPGLIPQPWWVNLLVLVPLLSYWQWRKRPLRLSRNLLLVSAGFAIAFGFVEAAVVVYLRAAIGILPGYQGTLTDVIRSAPLLYQQEQFTELPRSLMTVEVLREAATLVMLLSIASLLAPARRERWAMFLWVFAFWDIFYYAGLWLTIRWPPSLRTPDVLFLMPVPWLAQVWFPVLVSGLSIAAVALGTRRGARS